MSTEPQNLPTAWKPLTKDAAAQAIEKALIGGDLSQLDASQRVVYYNRVCESLGLNPLTKPFAYITLNGKLTLYALKDCTEQLRTNREISIEIKAREVVEDCYIVTARATGPRKSGTSDYRQDESIGAVSIAGLKGEARANAMMKAETKAKRRVTLSISGLGILDELEVETISSAVLLTPDPPVTVIDTATGAEVPAAARPEPPEGFRYIDDYSCDHWGWHRVVFNRADAQGGAWTFKTKLERVGTIARQAYQDGVPVRCEGKPGKTKGEWVLDGIVTWKPTREGEAAKTDPTAILGETVL